MADNSELTTQDSELPVEAEMPMLAGSAAARLTQQILSRLSSPFAVPSASPVRPGALWRQVARRLGVAQDDRARPRIGRSFLPLAQEQPRQAQDPFALEPSQLVWRTVASNKQAHQEEISPRERLAAATLPATRYITSLPPAPTPAQPTPVQATPQAAAPTPTPPTPIVSTPPTAVQPHAESAQVQAALPLPVEIGQMQGAPTLANISTPAPVIESAQSSPPTPAPPAKSITVEYVPGPAAMPLQPLVSHMPLIEAAPPPPRNLADTLNRDLVPLTDMISRMTRPSLEDLPLPGERPPAPTSIPASPVLDQPQPAQVERIAPPVPVVQAQATPMEEAPRLEMPLAATPTTSATRQTPQPAPTFTVGEALERAQRSPVRQLIDRVATAVPLPDAVRRFITGAPTPSERQPASTPIGTANEDGRRTTDDGRQVAPNATSQESISLPATSQGQAPQPAQAVQSGSTAVQPGAPVQAVSASPSPTVSAPTAPTSQPATVETMATSPQPSTPVQARQAQRAGTDIVPASPTEVVPAALEMPVRSVSQSRQVEARQFTSVPQPELQPQPQLRITQSLQTPASALGPFQAFQAAQPAQPAPQSGQEAQPTPQAQAAPQPFQAQQGSQSEPLGPFQPFQPAVTAVQPSPADEPAPVSVQAAQPFAQATPPSTLTPSVTSEAAPPAPTISVQPTSEPPQVARREQTASALPIEPTQAAPIAPTVPSLASPPTTPEEAPAVTEPAPRGFLGSIVDRLFGRGEREVVAEVERDDARPPAIEMPWVRQGRSTQAQQQTEQRIAPQPELPATRIADASAQSQTSAPTPIAQPSVSPSTPTPQPITEVAATSIDVTTATPVANIPPPPAQPAANAVDIQPQQSQPVPSTPERASDAASPVQVESAVTSTPTTIPSAVPIAASESISSAQNQPTSTYAPRETASPVEQASVEPSDVPELARVLATPLLSDAPAPLDMPHATQQSAREERYSDYGDDAPAAMLQRAIAPIETVVTPPPAPTVLDAIAPPLPTTLGAIAPTIQPEPATSYVIEQPTQPAPIAIAQASEPTQVQELQSQPQAQTEPETPQAWTLMPDMADGLVRSHAPISATEPLETAAQSDLLARILGSLGQEMVASTLTPSVSSSSELPRAVPVPVAGVGGAGMDLPFASPTAIGQGRDVVDGFAPTAATPFSPAVDAPASAARVYTTSTMASPMPIGVPAAPMVSRAQFMPDSLRDIRTTSNQPVASESVARAVAPESPSASTTPEPVSMPPRYITNVTPATYLAEAAMQSRVPGVPGSPASAPSPLGMIMHPASHMSPSMPDYGWPGEEESQTRATVMLPLSEMSPTADSFYQAEAGSGGQLQSHEQGQEQGSDWMATLQDLYGQKGDENMPLAVPYGGFAAPSEQMSAPSAWQTSAFAQTFAESSQGRPASQGISTLQMPAPSASTNQGGGSQSFSQPSGFSGSASSSWSSDSWSTEGMSEAPGFSSWSGSSYGYSDGGDYGGYGDSETGAWADVVASAASDTAPALALAAAESPPPSSPQEPTNTQDGGQGASADLDELAESVLDIIRNKIVIERERNFG